MDMYHKQQTLSLSNTREACAEKRHFLKRGEKATMYHVSYIPFLINANLKGLTSKLAAFLLVSEKGERLGAQLTYSLRCIDFLIACRE